MPTIYSEGYSAIWGMWVYRRVFDLYCEQGISFADAYNAAYMEARGLNEVYSYDTDFDRIEGIARLEPAE